MTKSLAPPTAPATAIDAAFPNGPVANTFPGQNPIADTAYLFDTRRLALLATFPDPAARSGLGAAVAFRHKDKDFVTRGGMRPGWRLDYVILPREFSDHALQQRLEAAKPPLLVEEEQFAVDLLRAYAERCFDLVPDLWRKWDEIHEGRGYKKVLLYPPAHWKPEPSRKKHAIHYAIAPNSLCAQWLERHGTANIPSKLEREIKLLDWFKK
ncbi:hypothetical protein [Ruegeria sp. Alg231-54]|jgi:hypothetical protein|uniref:hypothetical protein n=1 Tax=Ruegeria sp. Alg231-54 TaxID=1922221 RepID=UPI000D55B925|nr:hypothetical protein [Ruegeria sp. Alg231-54]